MQAWKQASKSRWLIPLVNVLLVLWLAWLLATITWSFFAGEDEDVDAADSAVVAPVKRAQQGLDERQIAGWHLFGSTTQQPVEVKPAPVDAPDTRLNLTLSGVFASPDKQEARAIIGDPRGREQSYKVGDSLPGGVKLSEIHEDRVILQRNGGYETLRLPRDQNNNAAARTVSHQQSRRVNARPGNRAVNPNAALQRYRNEIKNNPRSLMNYVRATPARENGQFIGFRLQAGRKPGVLQELGLQPGDVVTNINGVAIDNPARGIQAMRQMSDGQTINVTLLRGGQEVTMDFTLPASQ